MRIVIRSKEGKMCSVITGVYGGVLVPRSSVLVWRVVVVSLISVTLSTAAWSQLPSVLKDDEDLRPLVDIVSPSERAHSPRSIGPSTIRADAKQVSPASSRDLEDLPPPEPVPVPVPVPDPVLGGEGDRRSSLVRSMTDRDGRARIQETFRSFRQTATEQAITRRPELVVRDFDLGVAVRSSKDEGVVVSGIIVGSPADRCGMKPGDVVKSIGGHRVETPQDVATIVAGIETHVVTQIEVDRQGTVQTLSTRLSHVSLGPPDASATAPGDDLSLSRFLDRRANLERDSQPPIVGPIRFGRRLQVGRGGMRLGRFSISW